MRCMPSHMNKATTNTRPCWRWWVTTSSQLFNGPLSGTTRVSRYQKKLSPTHTHEEEEGFTQTTRSTARELISFTVLANESCQTQLSQHTIKVCNLHLAPGRQPHQHLITQVLQAWYSSWCPTNSVKALKAKRLHKYNSPSSFRLLRGRRCGRWPTVRPAATRAAGTQAYPSPACSCPSRTAASPGWSYAAEPGPSAPAYIKQVATVIVEKACMFQQSMEGGQQICRNDVRGVGCWHGYLSAARCRLAYS